MTNHVKIYGIKPRIQYTADGTLSTYEFPFAIFKASDLDVYFGETLQDSDTYTVAGIGCSEGGTVAFNTAPNSGTIITLVRDLSIERTSDFQEGTSLRAQVLNDELDYQIACQQQLADNLNRSMVLPPYAASSDVNLTLPTPSAGKAIIWDASGTNLENSTIEINALESTLNGYKTAAQNAAATASNKASVATTQAGIATTQATEAASAAHQLTGTRTNCLSEVPDDIKLELSSGTLTLKAGSKLTLPNGTKGNVTQDKSTTIFTLGTYYIFANPSTGAIGNYVKAQKLGIGTILPDDNTTYTVFIKTDEKKIYQWSSGQWNIWNISMPLAIVSVSGGSISSIDQVFNGFGFVGTTLFALPHIKGLIPSGRNSDGTLNITTFETSEILFYKVSEDAIKQAILLNSDTLCVANNTYNESRNYNSNEDYCVVGSVSVSGGSVISFTPKTAFHSADWNDKHAVLGCHIPDISKASSITLPYTTIEDCYIAFKHAGNSNASLIGNGIVINGLYGCGSPNGLFGQTFTPIMYGGLYVACGSTVEAMSSEGTYTVYKIPLKGMSSC